MPKTHILKNERDTYCAQRGRGPHATVYALSEDEVTEPLLTRSITCQRCVKGFRRHLLLSSTARARFEARMQSRAQQRVAAPAHLIPAPALTAPEIAAVLAGLADLWRGSDEAPVVRSVAHELCKALQAKSPGFDAEAFWRACRIDPEPRHTTPLEDWHWPDTTGVFPVPFSWEFADFAPGHPPGGVVVTADREDGGPVVVERIGR